MLKIFCLILALFCLWTSSEAGIYLNTKHILPAINYAHEAEKKHGIPENLLTAIAHVESKCTPYAVNAKGRGYYFQTKDQAVKFIQGLRAQGVRNINVGYMQLNLPSHINRFKSVDDMLDIKRNIDFAAALLVKLYKQYGSWPRAVERYKSGFSEGTKLYQSHVYHIWAKVKVPRMSDKTITTLVKGPHLVPQFTLHRGSLHYVMVHMNKILPPTKCFILAAPSTSIKKVSLKNLPAISYKMIASRAPQPSPGKRLYSHSTLKTLFISPKRPSNYC